MLEKHKETESVVLVREKRITVLSYQHHTATATLWKWRN
jgi:hypothetical protein